MNEQKPGPIDRLLGIFGDVRSGEGATVILMLCNVFLLLVAYYVLKTVREPLILLAGGAQLKSYAAAAQALTLIVYVPAYGWLASKLPRQKFLMLVILFFVGCIQLFFIGSKIGVPFLGFAFFVWVGIFSLTTIAQFWSYANEIYEKSEGDRLFPLIAVGSAAGAPVGAAIAEWLFGIHINPFLMMEIAAIILLLHLGLYQVVGKRVTGKTAKATEPIKKSNGFALVFKSHYLRLIALFLVLLNIVNTVGEYILGQAVVTMGNTQAAANHAFDKGAFIGSFYGKYFFWTNVVTILIQAFLVSRIVKKFGMPGVLLALPFVALCAYGLASLGAGLSILLYVKIAENSTDYSVMNTGKQMLWLPTSPEEKYKAKQAIDTFFVRFGDMLAAGVVFVGTHLLTFSVTSFALSNIAFVLMAIGVAVLLLREYNRITAPAAAEPPLVVPTAQPQEG
jgi:AAA family ATP:ADP antiporter